ncbi:MAG: glycosyltransferase family 2 protein [Muribaculaceae bacterium]|nr:glycosyltransferase family 2 protein [Muribaculaceae bacterium]
MMQVYKNTLGAPDKPVAVIILNWNGEKLLSEFLPSVVEYTPADIADIIVADNGSSDDSVKLLQTDFPGVKLLRFARNHGFAEGYNRAIDSTRYRYTVLLNSDVAAKSDWLTPLYEYMEANPDTGACQPKIRSYRTPTYFEYAGASGGYMDRNGYPYCRGRIFGTVEQDYGQYDSVATDIFWATGAALMVRTDLYLRAGGLDPKFFAHMEEIDLCWRIRLLGYKLAVIPDGVVYHLGGGSLDASNPKKTYLNFRNNLLMLHKNLPDSVRQGTLLRRRLLDSIAWAKFVLTFQWRNAAAIWRAHRDFAKMRKEYTLHPDTDLLHTTPRGHNIIVDYYLRGRKKFSQL